MFDNLANIVSYLNTEDKENILSSWAWLKNVSWQNNLGV